MIYIVLAEGPGVARRRKKIEKNNFEKKNLDFFLAFIIPRLPMSVHKKFQPNRFSRLTGYREHIYTNV